MMKKMALALLLALGTANVSAAVEPKTVTTVDADLDKRIRSLNLSEEKKNAVMQLMSDHKVLASVAVLALAAGLFVGVDCIYHKGYNGSLTQTGVDAVYGFLGTWVGSPATKLWNGQTEYKYVDKVFQNKAISFSVVAAATIVILAAFDLRKEEDKSQLKKLWAYLNKKADKPVVA